VANECIILASAYESKYDLPGRFGLVKLAYIRKLPNGKYRVYSEKGKTLGTYRSRGAAEKRLRQIEYFKHVKKADDNDHIDLSDVEDLTYSAILRELNKQCDREVVQDFLRIFKDIFDHLVLDEQEHPADKALPAAILEFRKQHPIEITND
jgi:hypothetical protein